MKNKTEHREWAKGIHNLWPLLVRKVVEDVAMQPERHSLLPRKYPVVVPGGRFRESYYWDTFWTIRCDPFVFFLCACLWCTLLVVSCVFVPSLFFFCLCVFAFHCCAFFSLSSLVSAIFFQFFGRRLFLVFLSCVLFIRVSGEVVRAANPSPFLFFCSLLREYRRPNIRRGWS